MSQNSAVNRRFVLASRPKGAPTPENFRLEEKSVPAATDGELVLHTLYLSLDPYMRGRMSDAPSYVPPVQIDEVMTGEAVSQRQRTSVWKKNPSRRPQTGNWCCTPSISLSTPICAAV